MDLSRLATSRIAIVGALAAITLGMYAGYKTIKTGKSGLPPAGPRKQDPRELDKMLDTALEDSMIASDPPSTVQPEVQRS